MRTKPEKSSMVCLQWSFRHVLLLRLKRVNFSFLSTLFIRRIRSQQRILLQLSSHHRSTHLGPRSEEWEPEPASSAQLLACSPSHSQRSECSQAREGTPPCRWATPWNQNPCGKPLRSPWQSRHQGPHSRLLMDCPHLRQTNAMWRTQDLYFFILCPMKTIYLRTKVNRELIILRFPFLYWTFDNSVWQLI